jgi:hypothetical protein
MSVALLRNALRPFAEYADQMAMAWNRTNDDSAFYGVKRTGAKQITYGDFRRASRIYASTGTITDPRTIVADEWHKIVKEYELRPGTVTEVLAARIMNRLADGT